MVLFLSPLWNIKRDSQLSTTPLEKQEGDLCWQGLSAPLQTCKMYTARQWLFLQKKLTVHHFQQRAHLVNWVDEKTCEVKCGSGSFSHPKKAHLISRLSFAGEIVYGSKLCCAERVFHLFRFHWPRSRSPYLLALASFLSFFATSFPLLPLPPSLDMIMDWGANHIGQTPKNSLNRNPMIGSL